MKRKGKLFFMGGAILLMLLLLLLWAESAAPDATIVSLPSALWYVLTTLTTVGYGDVYPVTAAGRIIGALFQIMSLGLFGALLGALLVAVRSRFLPQLQLRRLRGQDWYVFSSPTDWAIALARALKREDEGRTVLFPAGERRLPLDAGTQIQLSAEEICERKPDGGAGYLFCMDRDAGENERLAAAFSDRFRHVYCMSGTVADRLPDHEIRFDPARCCARLYWDRFPLRSSEEKIVLIGDGAWAEALLEQALAGNVMDPDQRVEYTVFGPFGAFQRLHPFLPKLFAADPGADRDSLIFMDGPWDQSFDVLTAADRIIFCGSDEEKTRNEISELLRYVPVTGAVHGRLSCPLEGVEVFGQEAELYTPALVMQEKLNETAMYLHELYRQGDPGAPAWSELSDFLKRSNLAAADHLPLKVRILLGGDGPLELTQSACAAAWAAYQAADEDARERFRRIEHDRWVRFHVLNNWQYAPERDNARRRHPLLVPFDQLSRADQLKDDYAWETLARLSGERI